MPKKWFENCLRKIVCFADIGEQGANKLFSPTLLGLALIDGYDAMGLSVSKPLMRASLESELAEISASLFLFPPPSLLSPSLISFFIRKKNSTGCPWQKLEKLQRNSLPHSTKNFPSWYRSKISIFPPLVSLVTSQHTAMGRYFNTYGVDFQVVTPSYSSCGRCDGIMDLKAKGLEKWREGKTRNSPDLKTGEEKLLNCPGCNITLSLPNTATTVFDHTCPLCKFQVGGVKKWFCYEFFSHPPLKVLSVQAKNSNNFYHICPYCYNNPPVQDELNMPCFKCSGFNCLFFSTIFWFLTFCSAAPCALASGSTPPFRPCPGCGKGKFRIKVPFFFLHFCSFFSGFDQFPKKRKIGPNGSLFTAACSEFQSGCKASFNLPAETSSVTVDTNKQCPRCSAPSQPCYHVTINFRKVVLGVGKMLEGCLSGCDRNINDLLIMQNQEPISRFLIPPSKLASSSHLFFGLFFS